MNKPLNYFYNFTPSKLLNKGFRRVVWTAFLCWLYNTRAYNGSEKQKFFYSIGGDEPVEGIVNLGFQAEHMFNIFGLKMFIYERISLKDEDIS